MVDSHSRKSSDQKNARPTAHHVLACKTHVMPAGPCPGYLDRGRKDPIPNSDHLHDSGLILITTYGKAFEKALVP